MPLRNASVLFAALRYGKMNYIIFILSLIAFTIWDVNSNHARVIGPVAWFVYRVAGGH